MSDIHLTLFARLTVFEMLFLVDDHLKDNILTLFGF